jgi:hypothetical protein
MFTISVRGRAWALYLPNGRTMYGRAANAADALCTATLMAATMESLIRASLRA